MSALATTPTEQVTSTRGAGAFTGTAKLARFILLRDRVRIPVWVVAVVATVVGVAASFADTFPTAADLQARAELVDGPLWIAFNGPGYGLDNYTLGVMVANESLYIAVILVALMSVFLTVRHTRAEEESGRAELVRSGVVGRYATTTAALLVISATNVVSGALTAAGLASFDELDWTGSLTYGLSMVAAGLVFTAVAALAAQITEYSRGGVGLGVAALAASYLIRGVGDASDTGLSWLSPFGWSLATRSFVDERWWPLLLSVALAAALAVMAMMLSTRRDVGAGLVPPRPGPPEASDRLVNPVGFAARLQRGTLVAWGVALLLTGATFGPLSGEVEEFAAENEQLQEILAAGETGLLESWLGMITLLLAMLATGAALQAVMRMRGEETAGRAEPVLAAGATRTGWMIGYLVVAMAGSGFVLTAGALGLGATAAINQDDASLLVDLLGAGLAYLPAVWLVVGLVTATFGLIPRAMAVGWLVLGYGVLVGLMGEALGMPDSVRNLSPFAHVPRLPGESLTAAPLITLTALAGVLLVVGWAGFRRRDVNATA